MYRPDQDPIVLAKREAQKALLAAAGNDLRRYAVVVHEAAQQAATRYGLRLRYAVPRVTPEPGTPRQ